MPVHRFALLMLPAVLTIEVDFRDGMKVAVAPEVVFALLSDIYRSGRHFPGVDELRPVNDEGRWRWRLKERGFGPVKLRVEYDAVYRSDPTTHRVYWEPPADGAGDMESSGSWEIDPDGDGGSHIRFWALTTAHIPAPRMMASMVEPIAAQELKRLKGEYIAAIRRTLVES